MTALDSSSDAAARRSECDPGLTVVCEPPGLKLPSAKPGLTTGASSAQRSRYESTPPSGRLVSDPLLRTGRNGFILFPPVQKPDSDKQQGAGGK